MKKAEVTTLKGEIIRLAEWAFSLDLHDIGARLCDCAEQVRQLLVVENDDE